MDVSVIIPTNGRPAELVRTLAGLAGAIPAGVSGEVLVVDNASEEPAAAPKQIGGWPARVVRLDENLGAGARNVAARAAGGRWLLMLDDDSCPSDAGWADALATAGPDVFAVGARVVLENGRHEAGGLPEVFVGCGALVRRDPFLEVGGYDESFVYYGEEADLCARFIASGGRVEYDGGFVVEHRRSDIGRDIARVVELLTRNEAVGVARYAPTELRDEALTATLERRKRVAEREGVVGAFERGLARFCAERVEAKPLSIEKWDRLTGREFARRRLECMADRAVRVGLPSGPPGKHGGVIAQALRDVGARVGADEVDAAVVVGTLAPGLAVDGAASLRLEEPGRVVVAVTPFEEEAVSG